MVTSEFEEEYDTWLEGRETRPESPLGEIPLTALRFSEPRFLPADATVAVAIAAMDERRKGNILVGTADDLQGIFTDRDLLHRVLAAGRDPAATALGDVMTPKPETLPLDAKVVHAMRMMATGRYRHLPVLAASGHVEGMLSVKHIVEFVVELFPTAVLNAPPEMSHISTELGGG